MEPNYNLHVMAFFMCEFIILYYMLYVTLLYSNLEPVCILNYIHQGGNSQNFLRRTLKICVTLDLKILILFRIKDVLVTNVLKCWYKKDNIN